MSTPDGSRADGAERAVTARRVVADDLHLLAAARPLRTKYTAPSGLTPAAYCWRGRFWAGLTSRRLFVEIWCRKTLQLGGITCHVAQSSFTWSGWR